MAEMLDLLEVAHLKDRSPHRLSGGEKLERTNLIHAHRHSHDDSGMHAHPHRHLSHEHTH